VLLWIKFAEINVNRGTYGRGCTLPEATAVFTLASNRVIWLLAAASDLHLLGDSWFSLRLRYRLS
jgi:hypothetical protein